VSISTRLHVVAAIFLYKNRVLAFRRASQKPQGGLWEFPGGKVEAGEAPIDALKREIFEELGFECVVLRVFDTSETVVEGKIIRLETFVCEAPKPQGLQSQDHDDFRFVSSSEASRLDWAKPDLPALIRLSTEGLIS
jgi:8-oxo-dGTP diphosphatase